MEPNKMIKRTARNYFLQRNGSDETLSEMSVEDYALLTTKTRRCFSENSAAVEEVKQLRFSVAQVEALTNASQENMLELYKTFIQAKDCPERYDQVKNKTSIIKSSSDITPIDDDDDPKVLSRYKERTAQEKHLCYLRELDVHKETAKPLVLQNLSVESVVGSFSYGSDETQPDNTVNKRRHPYFTRSQGSVHSQSTTQGSVQSPFTSQGSRSTYTSQGSKHSSDSDNDNTNNTYKNLDSNDDDGFSINA